MAVVPSGQVGEGLTERDRQREETRRRVREVALDVIRRDGLSDARVDEMARLTGVSRGTVYFHYPTKEHVVAEVLGEAEGRIAVALRDRFLLPGPNPNLKACSVFDVARPSWPRLVMGKTPVVSQNASLPEFSRRRFNPRPYQNSRLRERGSGRLRSLAPLPIP